MSAGVAARGTRSRAGNAMGRTREAALSGAVAAIAKYGARKATMGDIAMLAGIAKATLYNHFRTRDDVYAAVLGAQIDEIAAAAGERDELAEELVEAARLLAEHPALRRVVSEDPAILIGLFGVHGAQLSAAARAHVVSAVQRAGYGDSPASVGLVMSYLTSQVFTPSSPADRAAVAQLIARTAGAVEQDDFSAVAATPAAADNEPRG
jgi:AcrR family transcriptional regulator